MDKEKIINEVEERVKRELEDTMKSDMLGYISVFENRKKEILKEEYGIEIDTVIEKNRSKSID